MVWNYPEISKEDFTKLLKGFVDLLILASGFQSSGVPAHWDAENCRKALQWGLFFENVGFTLNSPSQNHRFRFVYGRKESFFFVVDVKKH